MLGTVLHGGCSNDVAGPFDADPHLAPLALVVGLTVPLFVRELRVGGGQKGAEEPDCGVRIIACQEFVAVLSSCAGKSPTIVPGLEVESVF